MQLKLEISELKIYFNSMMKKKRIFGLIVSIIGIIVCFTMLALFELYPINSCITTLDGGRHCLP